jgi:23S rRNA (adenine2030-N6)-methyltransferase
MNYQHAFHAGNFADVHKHVVLARILNYLRGKPAPFRVIDSHAGAGRYDLTGPEAVRSGEWQAGIKRILAAGPRAEADASALLKPYLDVVAALNADGDLRLYPGSPLIAEALLRRQDRLIACELEPHAAGLLKIALGSDPRAKVLAIDGWMAVNANVPPKERRGLVLIDPPYEDAADFVRLTGALTAAHRKWPTGIYMLWYPIKAREAADALARRLRRLEVPKVLRCEITLGPPRADAGLIGSGLIVVNPPYPLEEELRILLPVLLQAFSPDAACRLDWLVHEARNTRGGPGRERRRNPAKP